MPTRSAFLLAIVTVMLAGCGGDQWIQFSPRGGGFVVSVPAEPSEKEIDQDLPLGRLRIVQYMITTNKVTFAVHYTDYPSTMTIGRTADAMLDPGVEQMFSRYPQARKESVSTVLQGFPARSFSIVDPVTGHTAVGKACLVGVRTYVIQVIMPSGLAAKRDMDRFMDSFRITTNTSPRD